MPTRSKSRPAAQESGGCATRIGHVADVPRRPFDDPGDMVDDVARGVGWPMWVEAAVTGAPERAFSLPTGTVTFLMTDVEGSTQRWERAEDSMPTAIQRHYALLDEAIVSCGGVRPVEQGEGDSVLGAFSRASDAVAAALTAEQALLAEDWPTGAELRVRMAVHTGEAQLRDDQCYLGVTLNRCARIRAVAHGGQVVISASTAALVAERLPPQAALIDLGQHRLKDLGRPEHIWQLVHPDLPTAFPALRSLDLFHHNLPIQLTPLIGRDAEIVEVGRLLANERLVTLTGSAGVGKTRLALAVAADALDGQPGGVWWVELAPVHDPGAVGRAALLTIGARESTAGSVADQLAVALGTDPTLLVLDNCEHVIEASAELVAGVLATNPSASVLATSREPLGVPGEITWRVPSMRCPTVETRLDVPALSQYDAVALFVDRARRARPSFAVTDTNAPAIAQICHRLDGIPLAIELAAARCRQMSAEHVAAELDDRFRLLTGGARTVMPRQQTLAASVDWSHDRLDETERVVFRRLGVFAGPFPLEAAESIVGGLPDVEPAAVFDVMSRLVDKSLVVAEEGRGAEPRYRLLETLRAYALDRAQTARELQTLRDAHANWWADWLEPRGALPADDVMEQIDEFHANLRLALDWSADQPVLGLRLLRGVGTAWDDLGRAGDAMAAADRLLTDDSAEHHTELWLEAAWRAAWLCLEARGGDAFLALNERARDVARRHDDKLYSMLGAAGAWMKAMAMTNTALPELARQRGDRYLELLTTVMLAVEVAEDDPAAAKPLLPAAARAAEASGMRSLHLLNDLAATQVALASGDLVAAMALSRGILDQPHSSVWKEAVRDLSFAGLLARDGSALRVAVESSERALRKAPGPLYARHNPQHRLDLFEGRPSGVEWSLTERLLPPPSNPTLWLVCREAIDAHGADAALDYAQRWSRPSPHCQAILAAIEGAATGDEDRWHAALALALEQGFRLVAVDALEGLGVAAARLEAWTESSRLLAAAERLRDETGYRWRFGFEQAAVDIAWLSASQALGDDADAAIAEGRNLDWREAAAYARRARGERKRPSHGWASLTPTERQVVDLVAAGLTNPEIAERLLMGRPTVKTHLSHIFAKLGVRTRSELASMATRQTSV
jgi:predicted ATPase/class 3 adenylate cyclase/DNA-binding CsgD family transcriptional regulator